VTDLCPRLDPSRCISGDWKTKGSRYIKQQRRTCRLA
jgi:hypothetical protein